MNPYVQNAVSEWQKHHHLVPVVPRASGPNGNLASWSGMLCDSTVVTSMSAQYTMAYKVMAQTCTKLFSGDKSLSVVFPGQVQVPQFSVLRMVDFHTAFRGKEKKDMRVRRSHAL